MQKIKSVFTQNREIMLYSIIGVTGVFIDLLTFYFLYNNLGFNQYLANFISISLGITNNFCWNRSINFRIKNKVSKRFLSFYLVGTFGLILSNLIIFILEYAFAIQGTPAKVLSIPVLTLVQFYLNKNISFSKSL